MDLKSVGLSVPQRIPAKKAVLTPTNSGVNSLLEKLVEVGAHSAILTVVPPFNNCFVPEALDERLPILCVTKRPFT